MPGPSPRRSHWAALLVALVPLFPSATLPAQAVDLASPPPVAEPEPQPESCAAGEIVSARARDLKLFRNADCTYTALYGRYLHYQRSPGQWEDVDLTFRADGLGYVMDRHDIVVRIDGQVLRATERSTGKGIRWPLPAPPVVSGRRAAFVAGGLQWEYSTTKAGLKLSAEVQAPLGVRTWEFPYLLAGGARSLSVDQEGNLVSDAFTVPRPFALGADGNVYEVSEWRLLPGNRVAFDFDDSALPPEAFPYELDPTTEFTVATGTDDGYVNKTGILYPPSVNGNSSTGTSTISAIRSVTDSCPAGGAQSAFSAFSRSATNPPLCPLYEVRNALMRWNTSALSDNAVITGATLRATVSAAHLDDSRYLAADWYSSWPIDSSDYSESAQLSAINYFPLSNITTGQDNDFPLNSAGYYVSKTGYTGLRLHVGGGQPNGRNEVQLRSYESTTAPEPRLLVTYSTPPTITSVADIPDPVTAGDPITFSVAWSDTDPADAVRAVICKTNEITSWGYCNGGSWARGNLSGTSPSTVSFTPTAAHHGTQTYYAFACDAANACSPSTAGTFTVNNRTPSLLSVWDSPDPVVAGNPISFFGSWSDMGDSVRLLVCKTNQVSGGSCSGGGTWTQGAFSYGSPSTASFTPWNIAVGPQNYYAFACDFSGTCSSSSAGTFQVERSDLIIDELFAIVGQRVPGFGGVYMDSEAAQLFVWLTNPTQQAATSAQGHVVELVGDPMLGDLTPVPVQAQYEFSRLKEWYGQVSADILALPGAVLTDIDDARNRLNVGVESLQAHGPAVEAVISAAGIPRDAVILEEMEPVSVGHGLRHYHRPLVGGLQVAWFIDDSEERTCTLGVNAVRAGNAGIVTNSHCSTARYQEDNGPYFQPWFDVSYLYHQIGEEMADPRGFNHVDRDRCPPGRICRWSDANFVRLRDDQARDQGIIARPDASIPPNWDGTTFRIIDAREPIVGGKAIKVGKTTGRTSGDIDLPNVNRVCEDVNVSRESYDDNLYTVLCQAQADYNAKKGDSGSPVFITKNNTSHDVYLYGINWSRGDSNNHFSTITNIQRDGTELGNLKLCAPGFHC